MTNRILSSYFTAFLNASKIINVSAWQKYYGNISGNIGEELVFITGINVGTGIGNSSHNYETGIPSTIRNEGNVYFFVELK